MDKVVDLRVGPARDTLATLEGPFDFAFIDADKASGADTSVSACGSSARAA